MPAKRGKLRALAESITDDYHVLRSSLSKQGRSAEFELVDAATGSRQAFGSLGSLAEGKQYTTLAGNQVVRRGAEVVLWNETQKTREMVVQIPADATPRSGRSGEQDRFAGIGFEELMAAQEGILVALAEDSDNAQLLADLQKLHAALAQALTLGQQ
eukprot:SAG22_NODE_7597_length_725_cov_1.956869_1_plen_156_part_10